MIFFWWDKEWEDIQQVHWQIKSQQISIIECFFLIITIIKIQLYYESCKNDLIIILKKELKGLEVKQIKHLFTGKLHVSLFSSWSTHFFPLQWGLEGSVLTYHCGPGQYPYPVSYRVCSADGEWSPMRSPSHRLVSRATCKGNVRDAVAANTTFTLNDS